MRNVQQRREQMPPHHIQRGQPEPGVEWDCLPGLGERDDTVVMPRYPVVDKVRWHLLAPHIRVVSQGVDIILMISDAVLRSCKRQKQQAKYSKLKLTGTVKASLHARLSKYLLGLVYKRQQPSLCYPGSSRVHWHAVT